MSKNCINQSTAMTDKASAN